MSSIFSISAYAEAGGKGGNGGRPGMGPRVGGPPPRGPMTAGQYMARNGTNFGNIAPRRNRAGQFVPLTQGLFRRNRQLERLGVSPNRG